MVIGDACAPSVRIELAVHPVVELGDAQELQAQPRAAAVAGQQRDARGQAAARALAADRDPVGVDAELVRVLGDPHQRGVAVLERGRERVLRGEAVVDRDHDRTDLGGDPAAVGVVEVEAADHEAAAVEVDQRRERVVAGAGRPVAAHPHLGRVLRAGDEELVDLERDGRVVRRQRGQQVRLPGAGGRDVGEGELGEDRCPGRELGVVGVAGSWGQSL